MDGALQRCARDRTGYGGVTGEKVVFRYMLGAGVVLFGFVGLLGLYLIEIPAGNRDAVVLALGLVLGWGSAVVNYEFGSSSAGRKAADAGIARATDTPQPVTVTNPIDQPVPVEPRP